MCNCFKCNSDQHIFTTSSLTTLYPLRNCTQHLLATGKTIYTAGKTLNCGCPFGLSDPETPSLRPGGITSAHMPSHGFLSLGFPCPVRLLGSGSTSLNLEVSRCERLSLSRNPFWQHPVKPAVCAILPSCGPAPVLISPEIFKLATFFSYFSFSVHFSNSVLRNSLPSVPAG